MFKTLRLWALHQFRAGHDCYKPRRWLHASEPYNITWESPCEPYFVMLNAALPPMDTAFTGAPLVDTLCKILACAGHCAAALSIVLQTGRCIR